MTDSDIEYFPVPIAYKTKKVVPGDILPLLFTKYPIVISPNAETPYDYYDAPDNSEMEIGSSSPIPLGERYSDAFDSNPLSNPEVARMFAEARGWHFFQPPVKSENYETKDASFLRVLPFEKFVHLLQSAQKNHDIEQNHTFVENVEKDIDDWKADVPYLDEFRLSWRRDSNTSFNRNLSLSARLIEDMGSSNFDLNLFKLRKTNIGALSKQLWEFKFETGEHRNTEINPSSRKVFTEIYLNELVGRDCSEIFDNPYLLTEGLWFVNEYLKSNGNSSRTVAFKKSNSDNFILNITRDARDTKKNRYGLSIPEMQAEASVALEVAYNAFRQIADMKIKERHVERANNFRLLSEEMDKIVLKA